MVVAPQSDSTESREAVQKKTQSKRNKRLDSARNVPWPASPAHDGDSARISCVQASVLLSAHPNFCPESPDGRSVLHSTTLRRPASRSFNSICFNRLGGCFTQNPPSRSHSDGSLGKRRKSKAGANRQQPNQCNQGQQAGGSRQRIGGSHGDWFRSSRGGCFCGWGRFHHLR